MTSTSAHAEDEPAGSLRAWALAAGFVALIAVGLAVWFAYIYPSMFSISRASVPAYLTFASVGGLVAFMAPCAFPLLPAYAATTLGAADEGVRAGALRLGLFTAGGAMTLFLALGLVLSLVSPSLGPLLAQATLFIGAFLIVAGVWMAAGFALKLPRLSQAVSRVFTRQRNPAARFFVFGVGYAIASLGCTLPVLMGVFVLPFAIGNVSLSWLGFLLFALAMGSMIVLVTWLVGSAKRPLVRRLVASSEKVKRVAGVLLAVGGAYLVGYNLVFGVMM